MDRALPSLRAVRPELPGALDEVVACATAPDPEERYESVDGFVAAFVAAVGQAGQVAETYTPAENPYKGLRAFDETDAADFYGRALVDELVHAVGDRRLVAVVGPSGIGKSSVVKAGLVPALRGGALPGSAPWLVTDMFPGSYPYEELAAALLRVAVERPDDLVEELARDELGIRRVVKRILRPEASCWSWSTSSRLFTLTADEATRRRFLAGLTALAGDPHSPARVLVTLRADFLDHPFATRSSVSFCGPGWSRLRRRRRTSLPRRSSGRRDASAFASSRGSSPRSSPTSAISQAPCRCCSTR